MACAQTVERQKAAVAGRTEEHSRQNITVWAKVLKWACINVCIGSALVAWMLPVRHCVKQSPWESGKPSLAHSGTGFMLLSHVKKKK